MGKKLYPTDTLKQAQAILSAWKLIDPALKIGPLSLETIAADLAAVQGLQAKLIHVKNELLEIRRQRDTASIDLWDKVKGARSAIKIVYGDDSSQYELVGGTRRSERKKPRRKSLPESPE
jgi:hypothetical protein